ncbi:hypothetical protein KC351_g114 [Hortaea werneckii]|nr:hypothetical protein KC351_g114 [Hortaea werneckii]
MKSLLTSTPLNEDVVGATNRRRLSLSEKPAISLSRPTSFLSPVLRDRVTHFHFDGRQNLPIHRWPLSESESWSRVLIPGFLCGGTSALASVVVPFGLKLPNLGTEPLAFWDMISRLQRVRARLVHTYLIRSEGTLWMVLPLEVRRELFLEGNLNGDGRAGR